MPLSSSSSSPGHSRSRGSKGSITSSSNSNSNVEVSSTGASSSNTSPASATKAAAVARRASMAKKRASSGHHTKVAAGNTAAGSTTSRRTAASSTSISRNALSSSSSDASVALQDTSSEPPTALEEDTADTPDVELSRLTRDQLLALIVSERQDKDEVETRLSSLSIEHATLSESHADLLNGQALQETRLNDSYASTERLEKELSEHMETLDATREALKEAERGSREAQKRFSDQVELFESEQAKWHEIEQSLYNQISRLNEDHQTFLGKRHTKSPCEVNSQVIEVREEGPSCSRCLALSPTPSHLATPASPTFQIPQSTLEELQLLHTQISELSSDQTNLRNEIIRLENEVEEIQRVNSDLQEQNENYEVLLSERMLAGLSAFTDSGHGSGITAPSLQEGSRPPSSLDRLEEEDDLSLSDENDDGPEIFESSGDGNLSTGAVAANMTPNSIKRTANKRQSMIGLGGGGLDLEAELDRARQDEEEDREKAEEKAKRKKDRDVAARRRANQSTATIGDSEPLPADVETLRKEVKLLRQENKGLSTYVSKILEKIIGIEGFEKVLSVEKDSKPASTPTTAQSPPPPPTPAKTGSLLGNTQPARLPPIRTPSASTTIAAAAPLSPTSTAPATLDNKKKNRFSMDWFGSSLFKGSTTDASQSAPTANAPVTTGTSAPAPGLKPMRLTGGPAQKTAPTAEEDEDDRRTRARLQSEMRLLGIETTSSPATQAGLPGSVKIGLNRSPGQRVSSGSYSTSQLPPNPPAKETDISTMQRDIRPESSNRSSEMSDKSGDGPVNETVKIRGHRKKPSASFATGTVPGPPTAGSDAPPLPPRTRPTSIGLGLSYSKDSSSTSTWIGQSYFEHASGSFRKDWQKMIYGIGWLVNDCARRC